MTAHERATLTDRCARCDGAPDAQALLAEARAQLEEARRERDEARERARVSDLMLRLELADRKNEAASYANAIGRIESVLGMAGAGLLCKTVRAVDDVVKQLADARLAAEQGVRVAEALATEKAALVARVGVLSAALRGLVEAAQVMAESHAEFHDNVILLETVDDPMDAAIIAARAALEVEP